MNIERIRAQAHSWSKNANSRTLLVVFGLIVVLLVASSTTVVLASDSDELTIRYLLLEMSDEDKEDVLSGSNRRGAKSGDSILISTPDNLTILIDSGLPHSIEELENRLEELGVEHVDYAIATHPHWDHIGGFTILLEDLNVGQFYKNNVRHLESSHYRQLEELLAVKNIPVQILEEGDQFSMGDEISVEVLNPPVGTNNETAGNLTTSRINDLSLVLRLEYKDFSMLITGDIYAEAERRLVEKYPEKLNVRVLDVPHHGEDTSTTKTFVNAIKPEIAVISRDELASITNYNRLRDVGSEVYVTALNGEVVLRTDGNTIEVEVEQEINSPFLK